MTFDEDDLASADTVLAAVRDQIKSRLQDRDMGDQARIRSMAQKSAAELRDSVAGDVLLPLGASDTSDALGHYRHLLATNPKAAARFLKDSKPREFKSEAEKAAEKAEAERVKREQAFMGASPQLVLGAAPQQIRGAAAQPVRGARAQVAKGANAQIADNVDDERRRQERAMTMPSSPVHYQDALSVIRLLDIWRGRPVAEVDSAVQEIGKKDPYFLAAVRSPPNWFQRAAAPGHDAEVKRIINSEWRMDLTYAGHDFALPGAARGVLDSAQRRIVDVMTAIASRSALHGRYAEAGLDAKSPLGVQLFGRGTTNAPGVVEGLLTSANWSLGLRNSDVNPFGAVAEAFGDPRENWLASQIDFVGSYILPTGRDPLGQFSTMSKINLAPARTMLSLRNKLGGMPETSLAIMPDGEFALLTKSKIKDLYDRDFFTPNWGQVRSKFIYDNLLPGDQSLSPNSSYKSVKIWRGYAFNPYDQAPIWVGDESVDRKSGRILKSPVDLDHIVALNYAWERGLKDRYMASLEDREKLAKQLRLMTDFGQGLGLFRDGLNFAITASEVNRLKSSKGPDQWLPHPYAATADQHAGNLFYITRHEAVVRMLRAGQAQIDGFFDPNFMPTSLAERWAIEGVHRGYDEVGGDPVSQLYRNALEMHLRYLDMPDLSEETLANQAKQYLMLAYAKQAVLSFGWRLEPWNQAYLMARRYAKPSWNYAWGLVGDAWRRRSLARQGADVFDIYAEVPRRKPPRVWTEMSARQLQPKGVRNFMYEVARQGSEEMVFAKKTGELLIHAENKVLAPTFWQAYRYARGDANPFGLSALGEQKPPLWRLQNLDEFKYFQHDFVERFFRGDKRILSKGGPEWWAALTPERRAELVQAWAQWRTLPGGGQVPEDIIQAVRDNSLKAFRNRYSNLVRVKPGRELLNASPMVTDVWNALREGRTLGAKTLGAVDAIAFDLAIKAPDYSLRAFRAGADAGHVLNTFQSLPGIITIETGANLVATWTRQQTYAAPSMGRVALVGRRPFALGKALLHPTTRHLGARLSAAAGLTARSFQMTGGLGRLERMRQDAIKRAFFADQMVDELGDALGALRARQEFSDGSYLRLARDRADYFAWMDGGEQRLADMAEAARSKVDLPYWRTKEVQYRARYGALEDEMLRDGYLWSKEQLRQKRARLARLGQLRATAQAKLDYHGTLDPKLPGLSGGEEAIARNDARFYSLRALDREVDEVRVSLGAARRQATAAHRALAAYDDLPQVFQEGLKARGLKRFLIDLQVTNPRMTMFAGRLAHAPASVLKSAGRVAMAFGPEAFHASTVGRPALTGIKGHVARGVRFGGYGLSALGAYEEINRFGFAMDQLSDAGGAWQGLSDEQKVDLATYAQRSVGAELFGAGTSLLFADPIAMFGEVVAGSGSRFVRTRLMDSPEYRSDLLRPALAGETFLPKALSYSRRVKDLSNAGYISFWQGPLSHSTAAPDPSAHSDEALRVHAMAQRAALERALQRREAARTAHQRSAAEKALRKARSAVRWMTGTLDWHEGGGDAAYEAMRSQYPRRPSNPGLPLVGSTPMRLHENPRDAFAADRVAVGDALSARARGLAPDQQEERLFRQRAEILAKGNRAILTPAATDRAGGRIAAMFNRWNNRVAIRDFLDYQGQVRADSIMADTTRTVYRRAQAASIATGSAFRDPMESPSLLGVLMGRSLRGMLPIQDWERREAAADTLQTAQRRKRR